MKRESDFKNWLSLAGFVLAGGSFFAFLLLVVTDQLQKSGHPYLGILTFIVAPAFLVTGIFLIIAGWILQRIQEKRGHPDSMLHVSIDFGNASTRKKLIWFGTGAIFFLFLTAIGSYNAYHVTESVTFCGEVCHTMTPEDITYANAPHSEIKCVECHIGEGASSLVKAKMKGLNQVYQMITSTYPAPIKKSAEHMRHTAETCVACHWPGAHFGNKDKTLTRYLSDDENTPYSVRMIVKVGGGHSELRESTGIHWHTDPNHKIEFIPTDEFNAQIGQVRYTAEDGSVKIYQRDDFNPEEVEGHNYTMNCLDCHNRPAHPYTEPNHLVDNLLLSRKLNPEWEELKYLTVELLEGDYETTAEALAAIEEGLRETYEGEDGIEEAIAVLQSTYERNYFPEMNSDWEVFPSHIGHKNSQGCFRCHGGELYEIESGDPMPKSDCNSCHEIIAQSNTDKLIEVQGHDLPFEHPDGDVEGLLCTDCHTGALQ